MNKEFVSFRLPKESHLPLKRLAAHHRRKLAAQMAFLISDEYRRLIKSGELKEEVNSD